MPRLGDRKGKDRDMEQLTAILVEDTHSEERP